MGDMGGLRRITVIDKLTRHVQAGIFRGRRADGTILVRWLEDIKPPRRGYLPPPLEVIDERFCVVRLER